jgi:hypothetical protein
MLPVPEKDIRETRLDLQDIAEWTLKDQPRADIEDFRSMKDPGVTVQEFHLENSRYQSRDVDGNIKAPTFRPTELMSTIKDPVQSETGMEEALVGYPAASALAASGNTAPESQAQPDSQAQGAFPDTQEDYLAFRRNFRGTD